MKIKLINKKAIKKSKKTKIFSLVLAGMILASGLVGCSKSASTYVKLNEDLYSISSLDVLINEENDFHICRENLYRSTTNTTYGYRYGYGYGYLYTYINGEYKYGYGYGYCYSYGPIIETNNYYEYIDIEENLTIANDDEMNGYNKTNLSYYYTEEEYDRMNGEISYYDVKNKIEEAVNIRTK